MKPSGRAPGITPHLTVRDVERAARFYRDGFGFRIKMMLPGGQTQRIRHAEVEHAEGAVMLGPESPERGMLAPVTTGGVPPVSLYLYVDDVDAAHRRAVEAGAIELIPPTDQFFGARTSVVTDPDGHQWMLSQPREELGEDELRRRIQSGSDETRSGHSGPRGRSRRRPFSTT